MEGCPSLQWCEGRAVWLPQLYHPAAVQVLMGMEERRGPLSCCKERDGGKRDTGAGSGCCVVLIPRVLPHTEVLYLE